jgi:hypothetical protein
MSDTNIWFDDIHVNATAVNAAFSTNVKRFSSIICPAAPNALDFQVMYF